MFGCSHTVGHTVWVNGSYTLSHQRFRTKGFLLRCTSRQICHTHLRGVLRTPLRLGVQMLTLHATPWRVVKACHMTHGARLQCCTLKWPANCRGGQRGFLLLWIHIHAKPAGQHCPLRCLLCLLHLLLSRVTTLTFIPDTTYSVMVEGGHTGQQIMIRTHKASKNWINSGLNLSI